MSEHYCLKEHEWGELQATLEYIKNTMVTHVNEGDKPGGFRERLMALEYQHSKITEQTLEQCGVIKEKIKEQNIVIEKMKLGYVWAGIIGGIIGGLISSATPELTIFLIKFVKVFVPF